MDDTALGSCGGARLDPTHLPLQLPDLLALRPETMERDLARLLLTLMEFLRQVMESQALRRVEGGTLDDDQIERLGQGLMAAEAAVASVAARFGLERQDLTLDLGPLGRLV